MAVVWPTPTNRPTGYTVTAADWNTHADNLNNLNTRLGDATGPNNVMTRLSNLELLTGQTGTTGVGNYTLGDRLGTGVTTTTSPTTGTATAQLTSIRNNIGDRLSHGQVYTEIGALKTTTNTLTTNQGTRGSNGTIYSEIEALKNSGGGGETTASVAIRGALIANQSIASGSVTQRITWPTPVYNAGVTITDSGRTFAPTKTGKYMISFAIRFSASTGGTERAGWVGLASDSNARYVSWGVEKPAGASYWPYLGNSTVMHLDAGTGLSVYAYHNAGAALNLEYFGGNCNFSITYLGP